MPKQTADSTIHPFDRRQILAMGSLLGLQGLFGAGLGRAFAAETEGRTVAREEWARIDKLGDGLWSVISNPQSGNFLTTCNGGIVAGKDRVLVVEGFMGPDGAAWVAEQAHQLTGKWPTDVVISHYHGDHINGLAGFFKKGSEARVWVTDHTRKRAIETAEQRNRPDAKRREMLENADPLPTDRVTRVDLGGREVTLHPRAGHTGSDVTVEIEDPSTVFWGDLLWVGMFPNYMDAVPSQLAKTVRGTVRKRTTHNITGHGPVAGPEAIQVYLDLLDHVEQAARRSFEKGQSAADAAKAYKLPAESADWHLFRDTFIETAISAWHRELTPKT